jgi:steroid delta-isomerase-like uncharacterized protein
MTMTVREAFELGTEAYNAHDIDGFAEVLADDVVFRAPGGLGGQGRAACAEFYRGWLDTFPDAHVEVHKLYIIDETVVEEGTFTGTHDGVLHSPMGDIPATGRSIAVDYIHVIHFHEGKHVSFDLMFDRLEMLEQLGLAPTPVRTG